MIEWRWKVVVLSWLPTRQACIGIYYSYNLHTKQERITRTEIVTGLISPASFAYGWRCFGRSPCTVAHHEFPHENQIGVVDQWLHWKTNSNNPHTSLSYAPIWKFHKEHLTITLPSFLVLRHMFVKFSFCLMHGRKSAMGRTILIANFWFWWTVFVKLCFQFNMWVSTKPMPKHYWYSLMFWIWWK